jgi:hypothetical protein
MAEISLENVTKIYPNGLCALPMQTCQFSSALPALVINHLHLIACLEQLTNGNQLLEQVKSWPSQAHGIAWPVEADHRLDSGVLAFRGVG